jgi:hypothetical protein
MLLGPSTLFVNVESRYEAQKSYFKSFSDHLVYPIDFNSASDTLFIPDYSTLRCFSRSYYISSPWIEPNTDQRINVRSLAIAYDLHPGFALFSEPDMEFHNWKIRDLVLGIKHFAAVEEVFIVFRGDLNSPSNKKFEKKVLWAVRKRFRLATPQWCEIHGPQCSCTPQILPQFKRTTLSKLKIDLGADEILIDERKVSCHPSRGIIVDR